MVPSEITPSTLAEWMPQMWQLTAQNISEVLILVEPQPPYTILWLSLGKGIGKPLRDCLTPPQGARLEDIIRTVAVTGEPCIIDEIEVKGLHVGEKYGLPDNVTYWAVKSFPIVGIDGRISAVYSIATDITSTKAGTFYREAYTRERYISETLQKAMLPTIPGKLSGVSVACEYHAAYQEAHVGGDFFDLFCPSPGLIGMVIGDVSGKGVEATVRTAQAKYTLRAFAYEDPSPASVVTRLNHVVVDEAHPEGFVTLFYGVLSIAERTLCFVNAGHEPPLHLGCSDHEVTELNASGTALGITPNMSYTQHTVSVESGDRILLFTDGVTDVRNSKGFLDIKGLKAFFSAYGFEPPEEFTGKLVQYLLEWTAGCLKDDIAILLIQAE